MILWTNKTVFCICAVVCTKFFVNLGLVPYRNQSIDFSCTSIGQFLYAAASYPEVSSSKLQYLFFRLFQINKMCTVHSMPEECSGRKLRESYIWRIDFLFLITYIYIFYKYILYIYIVIYLYIYMYNYINYYFLNYKIKIIKLY